MYIWGSTCIWDKLLRRLDAVRHGVSIGGACNRGHCLAVTVSQIQTQINKHTNTNTNTYRTTNTLLDRHTDQVHVKVFDGMACQSHKYIIWQSKIQIQRQTTNTGLMIHSQIQVKQSHCSVLFQMLHQCLTVQEKESPSDLALLDFISAAREGPTKDIDLVERKLSWRKEAAAK